MHFAKSHKVKRGRSTGNNKIQILLLKTLIRSPGSESPSLRTLLICGKSPVLWPVRVTMHFIMCKCETQRNAGVKLKHGVLDSSDAPRASYRVLLLLSASFSWVICTNGCQPISIRPAPAWWGINASSPNKNAAALPRLARAAVRACRRPCLSVFVCVCVPEVFFSVYWCCF